MDYHLGTATKAMYEAQAADEAPPLKIYFIHSGSLYRRQVQSSCNRLLIGDWTGQESHEMLLDAISDSPCRPSRMALDALSLAQLGVAYQDPRIIGQALRYYQGALGGLRQQLALVQQGSRKWEHDLAWTPYFLFWCERFTIVSTDSPWSCHLLGFSSLVSGSRQFFGKTKSRLVRQSQIEMESFACAYFYVLEGALLTRHAVPDSFHAQIRRALRFVSPGPNLLSRDFVAATVRIPALIQDVDRALEQARFSGDEHQSEQMTALLVQLKDAIEPLQACESEWRSAAVSDPVTIVPTSHMPTYYADLDELSLQVFETAISVIDCQSATMLMMLSSCALSVYAALHAIQTVTTLQASPATEHCLTKATVCAETICKCAMFLYNKGAGATVAIMCSVGSIRLTLNWYLEVADSGKAKWCRCVLAIASRTGVRVPENDKETRA